MQYYFANLCRLHVLIFANCRLLYTCPCNIFLQTVMFNSLISRADWHHHDHVSLLMAFRTPRNEKGEGVCVCVCHRGWGWGVFISISYVYVRLVPRISQFSPTRLATRTFVPFPTTTNLGSLMARQTHARSTNLSTVYCTRLAIYAWAARKRWNLG